MERHDVLELLAELKLYGIRSAYDEIIATGVKRQHPVDQIVGDLLKAEIAETETQPMLRGSMVTSRGALNQIPAHHCEVTPRQGDRRLRLQQHADQRAVGA